MDLRLLWPREAADFTPWLAEKENLDELGRALGLEFRSCDREVAIGPFSVDVLAETDTGERVVIENELEPTDHDHLGKLLTYMSNVGAKKAVWITADPRPEHVKAVEWLNEVTPDDVALYLVRVRAYRIDGSRPAPHFSVVAGPVAERKRTERAVRELAERERLRQEFWQGFLERARTDLKRFARLSPTTQNGIWAATGVRGFSFVPVIRLDGAEIRLYVDMGPGREAETKEAFHRLEQRKADIERVFGASLEWNPGEGQRAALVSYRVPVDAGLRDREKWPELWEAMVQALARLERAVEPVLKGLRE